MNIFNQQLCGEFLPNPYWEYAEQYHILTESYDRTVCSYRNEKGIAIPTNSHESALINRNARQVFEELYEKIAFSNKTRSDFHKAIVNYFKS